jgi:hypothetical protein
MRHLRGRQGARNTAAVLVGAALFAGAIPAVASASACSTQSPESTAFAQFGDQSHYVLAPGGSFETGAAGWSLKGAKVVNGNESYNLVKGTHSLAVESNGTAVSPLVCVNNEYPTFRFVARQLTGSSTAKLNVSVRWVNLLGITVNASAGSVKSGQSWAPSQIMQLDKSLPLVGGLVGILSLELTVVFQASGGTFAIDDVYIDPYRR